MGRRSGSQEERRSWIRGGGLVLGGLGSPQDRRTAAERCRYCCLLGGQRVDDTSGAPPVQQELSLTVALPLRLGGAVLAAVAVGP